MNGWTFCCVFLYYFLSSPLDNIRKSHINAVYELNFENNHVWKIAKERRRMQHFVKDNNKSLLKQSLKQNYYRRPIRWMGSLRQWLLIFQFFFKILRGKFLGNRRKYVKVWGKIKLKESR